MFHVKFSSDGKWDFAYFIGDLVLIQFKFSAGGNLDAANYSVATQVDIHYIHILQTQIKISHFLDLDFIVLMCPSQLFRL